MNKKEKERNYMEVSEYKCPLCGYPLEKEMGLDVCYHCGWSKDETETAEDESINI